MLPDAAIEIGADRVTVAVVSRRQGNFAVTAHAAESLPAGAVIPSLTAANIADRAAVGAALQRALDRLGVRPRRVALIIPDSAGKVSLVHFDTVPVRADDLDQLVRWQVRKAAPFPVEDASITYSPGVAVGESGREFLVITARQDVIAEYESVCTSAGLYPGLVDLSTISLLNLFLASGAPAGDWLLVHVRADATSIAIMRGADVIFFGTRAEGEQESLADLVHQTAMYYQDRLSGAGFSRVLVGGGGRGGTAIDMVRHNLEQRLGLTVESVDPTKIAPCADRIGTSGELMDQLGPPVGALVRSFQEGVAA